MESKKSFSLKDLKGDLKKLLREYKDIEDFYIFGSFVKGKFKPADIDVALITYKKDFKLLSYILKQLKKYSNIHMEMFLFKEIFTEPVWKSLLSEGFSVRKNNYLRDLMNIQSNVLYQYSLKKMNRSEKTMFNRAFTQELQATKGMALSAGSAMIPIVQEKEFDEFLEHWPKAQTKKQRILIL